MITLILFAIVVSATMYGLGFLDRWVEPPPQPGEIWEATYESADPFRPRCTEDSIIAVHDGFVQYYTFRVSVVSSFDQWGFQLLYDRKEQRQ